MRRCSSASWATFRWPRLVALSAARRLHDAAIAGAPAGHRQEHHLDLRGAGRAAADPDALRYAHGEFRLRPTRARKRALSLIDWQLMAQLRGYDIAYFLGTSIPEEMRRETRDGAQARYLAGLQAGGVQRLRRDPLRRRLPPRHHGDDGHPDPRQPRSDTSNERSVACSAPSSPARWPASSTTTAWTCCRTDASPVSLESAAPLLLPARGPVLGSLTMSTVNRQLWTRHCAPAELPMSAGDECSFEQHCAPGTSPTPARTTMRRRAEGHEQAGGVFTAGAAWRRTTR